jgi:hypothetical protein
MVLFWMANAKALAHGKPLKGFCHLCQAKSRGRGRIYCAKFCQGSICDVAETLHWLYSEPFFGGHRHSPAASECNSVVYPPFLSTGGKISALFQRT